MTFLDNKLEVGFEPGVNPATNLPFGLLVQNNATLNQHHDFEIDGNLYNRSKIDLQDGNTPGTTLTVKGDYIAENGHLYLDAKLNGASIIVSDQLIVEGDTQGTTTLFITNVNGMGGLTGTGPNDGIPVVIVHGNSSGTFILGNSPQAGGYEYHLVKGSNGNWYLQSSTPTRVTLVSFRSQQPSSLPAIAIAVMVASLGLSNIAWWFCRGRGRQ